MPFQSLVFVHKEIHNRLFHQHFQRVFLFSILVKIRLPLHRRHFSFSLLLLALLVIFLALVSPPSLPSLKVEPFSLEELFSLPAPLFCLGYPFLLFSQSKELSSLLISFQFQLQNHYTLPLMNVRSQTLFLKIIIIILYKYFNILSYSIKNFSFIFFLITHFLLCHYDK